MFVYDAQLAFCVSQKDLGSTTVLDMFVRRFSESAGYSVGIETKVITGDGGIFTEDLNIDHAKLHAHRGLFVEVFPSTTSYGEASGLGANGGRAEDGGVGGVEFLQQVGGFGGENVPKPSDFSADFLWGKARHEIKLAY